MKSVTFSDNKKTGNTGILSLYTEHIIWKDFPFLH